MSEETTPEPETTLKRGKQPHGLDFESDAPFGPWGLKKRLGSIRPDLGEGDPFAEDELEEDVSQAKEQHDE